MVFDLWRDKKRERCPERASSWINVPVGADVTHRFPESSHLDVSPPPTEGLGADIGGHEVAVAHPPRPAEEVGQAVGDAGGGVAGSLLCCYAASEERTLGLTPRPDATHLDGLRSLAADVSFVVFSYL